VLGIALSTSILQQSLKTNLTKYFSGEHADDIINKIRQNVDYIKELPAAEKAAAIASYWAAMHNVFLAIMIAAILAVRVPSLASLKFVIVLTFRTFPSSSLSSSFSNTIFPARWIRRNRQVCLAGFYHLHA
jgi:hypothetical protein